MSQDVIGRPKIRILRCDNCGTLEELPDFVGHPEDDYLLEILLSRHETNGVRHIGRLIQVDQRAWGMENIRREIIDQMKGGSKGLAAFDPTFYTSRDTFREDALKCFSQHQRPKEGCHDYRSDSKILLPDTAVERKEIGMDKPVQGNVPVQWLCSFCPVHSYYQRKARGD